MGQDFRVVFLRDNEITSYCESSHGTKLMEQSYQVYPFMNAIESLLIPQGQFYKANIVWVGEYAKDEPNDTNLYHLAEDSILHDSFDTHDSAQYPFILNHTKKEYIDKRKITKSTFDMCNAPIQIHPLPLLTAEGNDVDNRGDYDGIHMELVSRWARDSISVETTPPQEYTLLECDFVERYLLNKQ